TTSRARQEFPVLGRVANVLMAPVWLMAKMRSLQKRVATSRCGSEAMEIGCRMVVNVDGVAAHDGAAARATISRLRPATIPAPRARAGRAIGCIGRMVSPFVRHRIRVRVTAVPVAGFGCGLPRERPPRSRGRAGTVRGVIEKRNRSRVGRGTLVRLRS